MNFGAKNYFRKKVARFALRLFVIFFAIFAYFVTAFTFFCVAFCILCTFGISVASSRTSHHNDYTLQLFNVTKMFCISSLLHFQAGRFSDNCYYYSLSFA